MVSSELVIFGVWNSVAYIHDHGGLFSSAGLSYWVKYWLKASILQRCMSTISRDVIFAAKRNCGNAPQHRTALVMLWYYVGLFGIISWLFGSISWLSGTISLLLATIRNYLEGVLMNLRLHNHVCNMISLTWQHEWRPTKLRYSMRVQLFSGEVPASLYHSMRRHCCTDLWLSQNVAK